MVNDASTDLDRRILHIHSAGKRADCWHGFHSTHALQYDPPADEYYSDFRCADTPGKALDCLSISMADVTY